MSHALDLVRLKTCGPWVAVEHVCEERAPALVEVTLQDKTLVIRDAAGVNHKFPPNTNTKVLPASAMPPGLLASLTGLSTMHFALAVGGALVAAMQDGGTVIYLRHAATNHDEIDTGRLGDRAGQRNLSAAGIEQARALGPASRKLGIPLDDTMLAATADARSVLGLDSFAGAANNPC